MSSRLDIDRIVFFGRTYAEYLDMFRLDKNLLSQGRILDCPAGASSFAAEAHTRGIDVTACDIMYDFEADVLLEKGREDIRHVFEKFDEVSHLYSWSYYNDKEEVMSLRESALNLFAKDFSRRSEEKRYIQAELPCLPFADGAFSLILSGHFLFLYNDRLDFNFHKMCLKELLRVSSEEVRIFPLTGLDAKPYPFMNETLSYLRSEGIESEIVGVPLEFQKGGNQMLVLRKERR